MGFELDSIIQADCISFMKDLEDKSIDLIYADPPFNTKNDIGTNHKKYTGKGNDNLNLEEYTKFCQDWFAEARRVAKRLVITSGVAHIGLYPNPLWVIGIEKPSSPSFSRFGGFNCWEPLLVYDRPLKRIPRDWVIYDCRNLIKDGRHFHPCPDNPRMVDWIVDTWSEEGETVLDPFGGSGTTAYACKKLNRKFIVVEICEEYVKLSRELLIKISANLNLFEKEVI